MTSSWTADQARSAGLIQMGARPTIARYLQQLWERREFALLIPLGELRQRNMNTVLGGFWHVLNPLFQAVIYYFLFGVVLDARGDIENYAVWLIVGLITFSYTQKSVGSASGIIIQRVAMLRSLNFPAGILPISVTLGELLAHGPALLVLLAVTLVAYDITLVWLMLLPLILLQTVFNLGLGLIVARLTVHFQDFGQLLAHVLKMWLLASGVMFPIDNTEGIARQILERNPAYVFIDLTRTLLFEGVVDIARLREAVLWAVGALVVGLLFFHRFEGRYSNAA